MNRLFRALAIAAACCPLLWCSPAVAADGTSSARLSNLRFSTLDLTPDDGIAAGFDIQSMDPVHVLAYYNASGTSDWVESFLDPDQPGTARVDFGPSFGEADATGAIGGFSTQTHGESNLTQFGVVSGNSTQIVWLTLRPNTVLLVDGHVDTFAEVTPGPSQLDYFAGSVLEIKMGGEDEIVTTTMTYASRVFSSLPGIDETHDDFVLAHANGSAGDATVWMYLAAQSTVSTRTPVPVPEPTTWAMLCAGLLLLGATGRYRRRT